MVSFNVIRWQKVCWLFSATVCLGSIAAMIVSYNSLGAIIRPSLDFVGGTRLQMELDCSVPNNCDQPLTVGKVRKILENQGLANSSIQIVGKEQRTISIRTKNLDVEARARLQEALTRGIGVFKPESMQIDTVGPTIGKELFISGSIALVVAFIGTVVYLSARFQRDYAILAIIALFHDVLITCGVFAVLGLVAGVEVDSLFLVALLTIIGYSVNDTVVIYDRVREITKTGDSDDIEDIVNRAVEQSLTRSLNTSLTTLLPLISIFLFGGETLKYFALALIVGFVCGTYSSIFIASTMLAWWRKQNNWHNPQFRGEIKQFSAS